jgi:hypothetical protein
MAKKRDLSESFNAMKLHPGVQETDPAKVAAADEVMKLALNEDTHEVPDELIAKAGRRALANRHFVVFTSNDDGEGGYSITGTAAEYMRKHGTYDERTGLFNALLPEDCGETCEITWEYNTAKPLAEAARELRDAGFSWDEKEQRRQDRFSHVKFTQEIAPVYAEIAPAPAAKPAGRKTPKSSR